MAVVVVGEAEFDIVVFTTPADGLVVGVGGGDFAVGSVGVGEVDAGIGAVGFPDVFREVPAVGVPRAVLLDGERAGGGGLGGIPEDIPQSGGVGARQVTASDLEVAAVEEAAVLGYAAVGGDLLGGAAAHGIVGALDRHGVVTFNKKNRAVFGVIGDGPDAGARLDERLVAVRVKGGVEAAFGGVLVQAVGTIGCRGAVFNSGGTITDRVIGIAVVCAVHSCRRQFAPRVIPKRVLRPGAVAGEVAGGGTTEDVIGVAAADDEGVSAAVVHLRQQVSLRLIALREREGVRVHRRTQQVRAVEVC